MRIALFSVLVATLMLCVVQFVRAADKPAKESKITGVIIDNHCGAKMMKKDDPEAAAADHPKACCLKPSCAASGYAVISGKELYKFDDQGNTKAKAYFENNDATRVVVSGTIKPDKPDEIEVTAIDPAPAK